MNRILIALIVVLATFESGNAEKPHAGRTDLAPQAARNEAALALIRFPWQQLKYEIVFLAPRHNVRAMFISKEHRIEIYARPADDERLLAYDIAHELGHAIDLTLNTNEMRGKWKKLRGINSATQWFGCNQCSDYNTPAGDFAETFALLLLGPEHFSGRIAPPPTPEQFPMLMPFFPNVSFDTQVAGRSN